MSLNCCCACFSDAPPDHLKEEDPRYKYYIQYQEKFDIALDEVPGQECCYCWYTMLCLPCSLYQVRMAVLEHRGLDISHYRCCQDYFPCPCIWCCDPCVQNIPHATLFAESCCCPGWGMSASRFMIMDQYRLGMHPIDNQIIRCNNAIQALACICDTLALCIRHLREFARIVHCVADLVFISTAGCMAGQVMHEIRIRKEGLKDSSGDAGAAAPVADAVPISEESGLLPADKQAMDRV